MAIKQILPYPEARDTLIRAVDKINDPIRQTLSPRGRNVIYTDDRGNTNITNDGFTIIKNLQFEDQLEQQVLDIVRHASMRTNSAAGDGTSTTVLLSSLLLKEGFRLVDSGWNPMDLKHKYDEFAEKMVEQIKKSAKKIKTDKDLFYVANISSNNDSEIAENVVKTIKTAGEDGLVFIEPSHAPETEIVEDTGFNIKSGLFVPELRNREDTVAATYLDVPVLITDKRLYYAQEAETILNTCLKNGYKEVVIVAKDFMGDALPYFVTNHTRGPIRVLLVKDPVKEDNTMLADLAVYLGGDVVSEKNGSIVDKLTMENFIMAKRAISDKDKTIISRDKNEKNESLEKWIVGLRKEIKKLGSEETPALSKLKERVASLTNGMVTIRVGGHTAPVVNEKIFRYEDAVNAVRSAIRKGYIVGGGLGMFQAFLDSGLEKESPELARVYRKVAEANIRQIAENCGMSGDLVIDNILAMPRNQKNGLTIGYNARTMTYDDLLEEGVVDPAEVEEMAIRNAADIAGIIISSGYYVINKIEKKDVDSKK